MLSFTTYQLAIVMEAAKLVAPEKRGVFLERVAARLGQCAGRRHRNDDVTEATQVALASLTVQHAADSSAA